MELQQVQPHELGDLPDLVLFLVDEHADDLRAQREAVDDRPGLRGRDPPRGRAEMKADEVGAGLDSARGALYVTDAADLHLDHAVSSFIRSSGLSARMRASPTRIAFAPAS